MKIMASGPITHANRWECCDELFSWAPNYFPVLQVVTAAMNLKDTCSLEDKLWAT